MHKQEGRRRVGAKWTQRLSARETGESSEYAQLGVTSAISYGPRPSLSYFLHLEASLRIKGSHVAETEEHEVTGAGVPDDAWSHGTCANSVPPSFMTNNLISLSHYSRVSGLAARRNF